MARGAVERQFEQAVAEADDRLRLPRCCLVVQCALVQPEVLLILGGVIAGPALSYAGCRPSPSGQPYRARPLSRNPLRRAGWYLPSSVVRRGITPCRRPRRIPPRRQGMPPPDRAPRAPGNPA